MRLRLIPLVLFSFILFACGGDDDDDVVIDDFADTIPLPGDRTTTTTEGAETAMTVTTTAFANGSAIPVEFTCDGDNVVPELVWSGEPAETQVIAITVVDSNNDIEHWIRIGDKDISPWFGPCPPPGDGPHSYVFTVHALGTVDVEQTRAGIEAATIASASITGTYERTA